MSKGIIIYQLFAADFDKKQSKKGVEVIKKHREDKPIDKPKTCQQIEWEAIKELRLPNDKVYVKHGEFTEAEAAKFMEKYKKQNEPSAEKEADEKPTNTNKKQ